MYQLYSFPYSQHARRVISLLEEANLPYELHHVDMMDGEYLQPEYTAINPNQQIPTLVDGDIKVHESNAILRYLCVKHELDSWYPAALEQRAAVEQWLDWNQCRLSPVVVGIVLNQVFMGDAGDQQAIAEGKEKLPRLLSLLDQALEHSPFLAGGLPTIADLSVASNIFHLSFAEILPEQTNVQRWFQEIAKLEGFVRSLPE